MPRRELLWAFAAGVLFGLAAWYAVLRWIM